MIFVILKQNSPDIHTVNLLDNEVNLMSACVSSALNSGMTTHVSHLHVTSALSMMHPFQNHQMAPSTIDMSSTTSSAHNQTQQNASASDVNEPNPEMLLALIARNKSLEGEHIVR